MIVWIVLTVLAAFGLLCAVWAMFGMFLPGQQGGAMVCICRGAAGEEQLLRYWGWLKGLGLLRCPVLVLDGGMTREELDRLLHCRQDVELCTLEALAARLEQERNKLDRTGT